MEYGQNTPDDIIAAMKYIQAIRAKKYPTREEREDLNRAKLRIAYWACRVEGVVASRDNLEYVLGADAADIIKSYDKYLITEAEKAEREKRLRQARQRKARKDGGKFWGGADNS